MPDRILLEIAVDSEADAAAAVRAGADRLELCASLAAHGYTPRVELVRAAAASPRAANVAMVRPADVGEAARGFVYTVADWARVMRDAEAVLDAGAGGIVFGCLTAEFNVDAPQVRELVRLAGSRETVFHRAFDLTPDPLATAAGLADLGVTRILTSGLSAAQTVAELGAVPPGIPHPAAAWHRGGDAWGRRLERIRGLERAVGSRIDILPGGGIRAANAAELLADTDCRLVHSSGRVEGQFDRAAVVGLRAAIDAAR